jgi:hypothetical protein
LTSNAPPLHTLSDSELRSALLPRAAASTTALAPVDQQLPSSLLTVVMRSYLAYFRTLTGATRIELYATRAQQAIAEKVGLQSHIVAFHVPWQKEVRNLARLAGTAHSRPMKAIIHAYEWANHFHQQSHGCMLYESPGALEAFVQRTQPTEDELTLLDEAAGNNLQILFETVVDRELYDLLHKSNQSREAYLYGRLDYILNLRDAWLERHSARENDLMPPIGIALNPWHAAMEMRGAELLNSIQKGASDADLRAQLLPDLTAYVQACRQLIRHFYAGNSRRWELRLPEMLQRGRFLDPDGIIPELDLLRIVLRDRPTIADAITLEAPPQSALFSGRLNPKVRIAA